MSAHNQKVSFWEDLEGFLLSISTKEEMERVGNPPVYGDLMLLTTLIWYDLHPGPRWIKEEQLSSWFKKLVVTPYPEVLGAFKTLSDFWVESNNFSSNEFRGGRAYFDFKGRMNARHVLCGYIMFPLKQVIVRWFNDEEPLVFGILRQAFCFPLRVNIPGSQKLEDEALTRYLENEKRLHSLILPDTDLSSRIGKWFPLTMTEIFDWWHPSHGPGSVADVSGRNIVDKYNSLVDDEKLTFLKRRLPRTYVDEIFPMFRSMWPFLDRTAEVLFVPKSWDKLRTICRECATLQWYEQGFRRSITRVIERYTTDKVVETPYGPSIEKVDHPLKRRIRLARPEQNRALACEGSIDGVLCTIDLTDASDSISYSLVKRAFRKSVLLSVVYCCRTSSAYIPGDETPIHLEKFAPMGSALCFPVMCIILCALCEEAITMVAGEDAIRYSKYSVYGDDIVIEKKYLDALFSLLDQHGFKINKEKSCFSDELSASNIFRESCGGEYLSGVDVTPVRISRRFTGIFRYNSKDLTLDDARSIESQVDLINRCSSRLKTLRAFLISKLLDMPPHLRPCFSLDGNDGIKSSQPTNFQLAFPRYNVDYQRYIWKCGQSRMKAQLIGDSDEIRLLEYLRSTSLRDSDIYESEATQLIEETTVAWCPRINYSIFSDPLPAHHDTSE